MEITQSRFEHLYSLEDVYGKGRFGEVFKSKNRIDSLYYAVKIIDQSNDVEALKTVFKERNNILDVGHDNIMQVFNFSVPMDSLQGI